GMASPAHGCPRPPLQSESTQAQTQPARPRSSGRAGSGTNRNDLFLNELAFSWPNPMKGSSILRDKTCMALVARPITLAAHSLLPLPNHVLAEGTGEQLSEVMLIPEPVFSFS